MIVDRQTHTHTHTHTHTQADTLVTTVRCPIGGGVKTSTLQIHRETVT